MKFTTPEDYKTLMESIAQIDNSSLPPKKTLTESTASKLGIFESIGETSVEVEMPEFKSIDLTELKFNLEER